MCLGALNPLVHGAALLVVCVCKHAAPWSPSPGPIKPPPVDGSDGELSVWTQPTNGAFVEMGYQHRPVVVELPSSKQGGQLPKGGGKGSLGGGESGWRGVGTEHM